jgi:site-specific DNA-methyltransferase (adenine-specific)
MPDNSVDSIVTDPPSGLSFMGKKWDYDVPSTEIWAECLRVLKPGGHLLAFAGTRTQHRMAVRIEDAGFEIRDMIAWVYGSGFPKSHNVAQAIDREAGFTRDRLKHPRGKGFGDEVAQTYASDKWTSENAGTRSDPTAITESASQWQGWGTALKPALEPITVARKPLVGTVAENVLEHGTGGLNIDGCRVGDFQNTTPSGVDRRNAKLAEMGYRPGEYQMGEKAPDTPPGRWPANLIHDGSDEVMAAFPQAKGQQGSVTGEEPSSKTNAVYGQFNGRPATTPRGDAGSAARFFYCAKASKRDRDEGLEAWPEQQSSVGDNRAGGDFNERLGKTPGLRRNVHPTVKPTDLMRYLCRLVTPPGGVVLDPFMGSGSTGKAAKLEGFGFAGCEMSSEYFEIACARIEAASKEPVQDSLF